MDKVCNKCNTQKPIDSFFKNKCTKDGLQVYCKVCHTEDTNNRKASNPQRYKDYTTKFYEANKESVLKRSKQWNKDHPAILIEWQQLNPQAYKRYRANTHNKRKLIDLQYVLIRNIRGQVNKYIKAEGKKHQTTENLLGYSYETFINILGYASQSQHLDHKIPVSWFVSDAPVSAIFNLNNLQWLSQIENTTKSNRFAHPVALCYYKEIIPLIRDQYKSQVKCCE